MTDPARPGETVLSLPTLEVRGTTAPPTTSTAYL
jgi:hypothetical protein